MNPLVLLGWVGLPAFLAGSSLTSATLRDPALAPKIGGFDARAVVGIVGLGIATLMSGPLGWAGAGVALGSALSFDDTRKMKIGLNTNALHMAQQQAQIPMQAPAQLPGPAVPPIDTSNPNGQQLPGFWQSLFSN